MKTFLWISFLLAPTFLFPQAPDFIKNTPRHVLNGFPGELITSYDFVVSYSKDSYWFGNEKTFSILALKNKKWILINYINDSTGKSNDAKISTLRYRIPKKSVKKLFHTFGEQRIWTLNSDSLKITERRLNDSMTIFSTITDGTYYEFRFIQLNKERVVAGYEPYHFLKEIPEVPIRKNFIICLEAFEKLQRKYSKRKR